MNDHPLGQALSHNRVLVCVGSGGVGKTTVAAALALRAAMGARSSLVCTIDPARRLANSLGLQALGNAESEIPQSTFRQVGLSPPATMHAMMLDMKRSWDELIEQRAPPEKRDRILQNRFYQSLSTALAGSQEYIAMEKLWQLRHDRQYELIVLDTPPTAHALDFLEAPNRLLDFLDHDVAKWLLTPALAAGKVGLKLFNLGGSYAAKTLAKFTGTETLQELASFMSAMSGLNEGFRQRAKQTRELLAAPSTSFVLVTSPGVERLDEALHFHALLQDNQMRVSAVVVNRVHTQVSSAPRAQMLSLAPLLRDKLLTTLHEQDVLAIQDAQGVERLREACHPTPIVEVPRFPLDVHDLQGLWQTSQYLVGERSLR